MSFYAFSYYEFCILNVYSAALNACMLSNTAVM